MNNIVKKILEILCSNRSGYFCAEDIQNQADKLRRKLVEILTDKRGELDIPREKIDAITEVILPDIIAFFQSEEGKRVFEEWKKEQEKKKESA